MDVFTCSKTLHNEGFNTWYTAIRNICKLLNVSVTTEMLSEMSSKSVKKYIKNVMFVKFKTFGQIFELIILMVSYVLMKNKKKS